MSWQAIALLGVGTFALRAAGLAALGRIEGAGDGASESGRGRAQRWPAAARALDLLPAAILAALVALETFTAGGQVGVDARTAAVLVAAAGVAARLPLIAVVVGAAAVAAALRFIGVS